MCESIKTTLRPGEMPNVTPPNRHWHDKGKTLRSSINVGPGQAAKRLSTIDDVSFARRHKRFSLTLAMHESTASWSRFLYAARENLPIVNSRAFARSER